MCARPGIGTGLDWLGLVGVGTRARLPLDGDWLDWPRLRRWGLLAVSIHVRPTDLPSIEHLPVCPGHRGSASADSIQP